MMKFLGIEFAKTPPHYRRNRFLAFLIDLVIVITLWFIMYQAIGKPDFFSVRQAMDSARALPAESQQEAMNLVFAQFDSAFRFGLIIWFIYDALTSVLLNGRTVGKLLMGLQIVPMNPKRSPILHYCLLIMRSALKLLSLYLLRGFPFIICALNVLANESRSGFDVFVRTKVIEMRSHRKAAEG